MQTIMQQEANEAPKVVAKQLKQNAAKIAAIAVKIREKNPEFVLTVGRGSSDNACNYAKYLFETKLNLVTASAAPSVVTTYKQTLKMQNALVIGISQSGKSPDICEMMRVAREQGAVTVAIVNVENSPMAVNAEYVIPILAGEEKSVAATKTFIASLTAVAQLVAILKKDMDLLEALNRLPENLAKATECDWHEVIPFYKNIVQTYVIGRGYSYPVVQEAALKFIETASIHAQAFSSADLMHGPFTLVLPKRPFLLFAQNDATLSGMVEMVKKIGSLGGYPIMPLTKSIAEKYPNLETELSLSLPLPDGIHPLLDPIVMIQAFYPMMANLAVSLGKNPDAPEHLKKVTETL